MVDNCIVDKWITIHRTRSFPQVKSIGNIVCFGYYPHTFELVIHPMLITHFSVDNLWISNVMKYFFHKIKDDGT